MELTFHVDASCSAPSACGTRDGLSSSDSPKPRAFEPVAAHGCLFSLSIIAPPCSWRISARLIADRFIQLAVCCLWCAPRLGHLAIQASTFSHDDF